MSSRFISTISKGDHVTGTYCDAVFTGTVDSISPQYQSADTWYVRVALDSPTEILERVRHTLTVDVQGETGRLDEYGNSVVKL